MTHFDIRQKLFDSISMVASNISNFPMRHGRDFTRNRKLSPETLIKFLIAEGSSSTKREYPNGCIILEPRELVVPESVSARTLKGMDRAIDNFKMGDVSEPVDLSDF